MTNYSLKTFILSITLLLISSTSSANEVEVVDVKAKQSSDKSWSFNVTLKHADEGWDHYANEWQVIAPDNKILGTRTLYHPHVNEQPFTRSLSGVKISKDITSIRVIAKDTIHGLSSKAAEFNLSTKESKQIILSLEPSKKKKNNG